MIKQKIAYKTLMALDKLIKDIKDVSNDNDPEAVNEWSGEFVLSYNGTRYKEPRIAVYFDHSIPAKADGSTSGAGFGMWWCDDPEQGLTADEDLEVIIRG